MARTGLAIDAIGPGTVTSVVDAAGLARLLRQGLRPLAVTPLDFPPADSAYHNYAELVAAIEQTVAAYPGIVRVSTVGVQPGGTGHPGRQDQRRAGYG